MIGLIKQFIDEGKIIAFQSKDGSKYYMGTLGAKVYITPVDKGKPIFCPSDTTILAWIEELNDVMDMITFHNSEDALEWLYQNEEEEAEEKWADKICNV